jgi:hypothetical protein
MKKLIIRKVFQKFLKIIHLVSLLQLWLTHGSLYHSHEPSCEPQNLTSQFIQENSCHIEILITFSLVNFSVQ